MWFTKKNNQKNLKNERKPLCKHNLTSSNLIGDSFGHFEKRNSNLATLSRTNAFGRGIATRSEYKAKTGSKLRLFTSYFESSSSPMVGTWRRGANVEKRIWLFCCPGVFWRTTVVWHYFHHFPIIQITHWNKDRECSLIKSNRKSMFVSQYKILIIIFYIMGNYSSIFFIFSLSLNVFRRNMRNILKRQFALNSRESDGSFIKLSLLYC